MTYAPPADYSTQLMEMLIAGKPAPVQPASFNVPSMVMPQFTQQNEDPMNFGSAGDAMDLTGMLLNYFGGKGGPGASPTVQGGGGMPQAFNAASAGGMLGQAMQPSMSPQSLMKMLGL